MAGHSKWAQIKRKKAVTDSARSKVFGKFARLIAVESKKVSGDVSAPSLRAVIERAKQANMPKDNIDRAVAKGASADTAALESVLYETYGPGGVAILLEALTDSRNRTSQEIKILLGEHDCSLAAPGSAAWAFMKGHEGYVAQSTVEISNNDGESLASLLEALDENDDIQASSTSKCNTLR
ncbi:MAG: YebC/PmpR family DNA-binding transcriptional regulator [Parcubacteria group bacterium]|nr:YebC/PmpR family DNA-binding transcriptional regulator [Parcubacteria group bacterium]